MVLAGQRPEVIMEICSRAMSFWTYQVADSSVLLLLYTVILVFYRLTKKGHIRSTWPLKQSKNPRIKKVTIKMH